ncbi:MAG: hypothetical protein ACRCT6_00605, partial [Notoacmeibacter sp.]
MIGSLAKLCRNCHALAALVLAFFLFSAASFAQSPAAKTEEAEAILQINTYLNDLKTISQRIEGIMQDDDALLEARIAAEQTSRALIDVSVRFRPAMKDITTRLETLRAATAEGATPTPDIASGIKALNDRKALINSALAKAEDGTLEASSLADKIGLARRDL